MPIGGYAVFSDESEDRAGRFRSIAAVSMNADAVVPSQDEIAAITRHGKLDELKWVELNGAKNAACARAVLDYLLDELLGRDCHVDVIVWDTQDTRHSVPGRDDQKNFERMFFHLHKALMARRRRASWHIRPDERTGIDWETIRSCLGAAGRWRRYFEHPLLAESFSELFYEVRSLKPVASHSAPLCQVADLFAGMAVYTRSKSEAIKQAIRSSRGCDLFLSADDGPQLSGRDRARIPVVLHLNDRCKQRKLGVSLKTHGYLHTFDRRGPISFWHYTPQRDTDKAPTR